MLKKKRKEYGSPTGEGPQTETPVERKVKPKARVAQGRPAAMPLKALIASFDYKTEQYCNSPFMKTALRDHRHVTSFEQSDKAPV